MHSSCLLQNFAVINIMLSFVVDHFDISGDTRQMSDILGGNVTHVGGATSTPIRGVPEKRRQSMSCYQDQY